MLHVRLLPDFDGHLNGRDAELLLSYLTAPYVRVPLLLQLFADATRVRALGSPELRDVVDACLFEPGAWQPRGAAALADAADGDDAAAAGAAGAGDDAAREVAAFDAAIARGAVPATAPAKARACFATPCGLLFNELTVSPATVIGALDAILDAALDLDVGRYAPATSGVILYAVRLLVRVESYVLFVLAQNGALFRSRARARAARARPRARAPRALAEDAEKPPHLSPLLLRARARPQARARATRATRARAGRARDGRRRGRRVHAHGARGRRGRPRLDRGDARARLRGVGAEPLAALAAAARRWRQRLDGVAYPMLARWCRGALGARRMGTACVVYAHLALLFRNVRAAAFGRREVATLLTAQVFLNINYTFDAEPTVDAPLDDAAAAGGASAKGGGFRREARVVVVAVACAGRGRRGAATVAAALGFSQTEFFELMQRHRRKLLSWLEAHAEDRAVVLEAVARVVTLTQDHSYRRGNAADGGAGGDAPKEADGGGAGGGGRPRPRPRSSACGARCASRAASAARHPRHRGRELRGAARGGRRGPAVAGGAAAAARGDAVAGLLGELFGNDAGDGDGARAARSSTSASGCGARRRSRPRRRSTCSSARSPRARARALEAVVGAEARPPLPSFPPRSPRSRRRVHAAQAHDEDGRRRHRLARRLRRGLWPHHRPACGRARSRTRWHAAAAAAPRRRARARAAPSPWRRCGPRPRTRRCRSRPRGRRAPRAVRRGEAHRVPPVGAARRPPPNAVPALGRAERGAARTRRRAARAPIPPRSAPRTRPSARSARRGTSSTSSPCARPSCRGCPRAAGGSTRARPTTGSRCSSASDRPPRARAGDGRDRRLVAASSGRGRPRRSRRRRRVALRHGQARAERRARVRRRRARPALVPHAHLHVRLRQGVRVRRARADARASPRATRVDPRSRSATARGRARQPRAAQARGRLLLLPPLPPCRVRALSRG